MADNLNISLIIRAINQASAPLRQVANDINNVSRRSADLRQAAGTLARIGTVGVATGAAISYGLYKITGPAQEVQEQLHRLRNTLPDGASGMAQLAQAEQASAQWSTKLGLAQEGLIKQIYLGTSAGLNMAESIKAMGVASQLAQGLGGDLEATQRTLNLAYINFKDPSKTAAENIQNLGDIMATANGEVRL